MNDRFRGARTAAVIAAACLVLAATMMAQQVPPQLPSVPLPPSEFQAPRCNAVVGGTVSRRVGPNRQAGLKGIQVQILDADGNRVGEVRTDRDGRYVFRDLCPGTYTVCPGTPCPAGGRIPSRFEPAMQDIRVPPIAQTVDFLRLPPPPIDDGRF